MTYLQMRKIRDFNNLKDDEIDGPGGPLSNMKEIILRNYLALWLVEGEKEASEIICI